jgi:flagellar L-ring protein precursor FlgH
MAFMLIFSLSQTGCASFGQKLKAFLGGHPAPAPVAARTNDAPVYSETPNYINSPRRQYRRVTKQSFEEDAHLGEKSGSLWTMEGQGAYLFSQNIVRMIGDPIGIKIEGEPKEQLGAKVDVIRKLLAKLEERQQARLREPASEGAPDAAPKAEGGDDKAKDKAQAAAKPAAPPGPPEDFSVKTVPTRIVERMIDGNYRVKGSQPFMVGQREYKVIVTGIVRAEDFNEEGLSATKLLDPKFDIVSVRRKDADI